MPSLNDVQVKVSTTADNSGIKEATTGLSGMVDNFQAGMRKVSVVTGVAGAALTAFSKGSVDYLKDVVSSSKALAQQTGMTVIQSSQLLAVMGKLGIDASKTSAAFKTFTKQISDSRDNNKAHAAVTADMNNKIQAAEIQIKAYTDQITKNGDATGVLHNKIEAAKIAIDGYRKNIDASANTLDKLGVVTVDASGKNKDFNTILMDVADKFHAMPDGVEKSADALALFGRSGQQMIKVLDKGSDGIRELEKQADKLGLTLTAQNIGAISDYIKSQKNLADSTNSIKIQVGALTAPLMTKFNEALNKSVTYLVGMDSPFRKVTADVLAFGGPVLGATSAVAGFLGNIGSAAPLFKTLGTLLINPVFIAFELVVLAIAGAVFVLRSHMKSWGDVANVLKDDLSAFAKVLKAGLHEALKDLKLAFDALKPSLTALWNSFKDELLPAIDQLWNKLAPILIPLLKDLAKVFAVTVFAAVWIAINALNDFIKFLTPIINFLAGHTWIVYGLATAFTVLAADMAFTAIFNALSVGFATLTLVTIPSAMASVGALAALIASPIVMGAILVGAAIAAIFSVRDAANAARAAVDGAQRSAQNYVTAWDTAHAHLQQLRDNGTPEQKARANAALRAGYASGGFTGTGGEDEVAGIVHKGEYVIPQKAVDQRTGMPKIASSGTTMHINNFTVVLPNVTDKASFIQSLDQDMLNMSKGLSPVRGAY